MPTPILGPVVAHAAWPESVIAQVEAACLSRSELHDALARNPFITEATWLALYTAKPLPSARRAEQLVCRPLSDVQAAWAASIETRSSVMECVLDCHQVDQSVLDRLARGQALSQSTAAHVARADWVNADTKEAVARKASGLALLRWFASAGSTQCDQAAGEELISTWDDWWDERLSLNGLVRLLGERRPELHEAAIARGPGFAMFRPVLTSRHLSKPKLAKSAIAQIRAQVAVADAVIAKPTSGPVTYPERVAANRAERQLNDLASDLIRLVDNPVVAPELATEAYEVFGAVSYNVSCRAVEQAYRRRCSTTLGAHDPMDRAITTPYEQVSDPKELAYLVRSLHGSGPSDPRLLALAANPHLGAWACEIANRLRGGVVGSDAMPDWVTAVEVFGANYPEVPVGITRTSTSMSTRFAAMPRPTPTYLVADPKYGGKVTLAKDRPDSVETMPPRYPLSLRLIDQLSWNDLSGVAHYLAKRLGNSPAAWQALFGLADDLAANDLDTLCDTVCALTE